MQLKKRHKALLLVSLCLTFSTPIFAAEPELDANEVNSTVQGSFPEQVDSSQPLEPVDSREQAIEKEKEKLAEDPTKVVTQLGIRYDGDSVRFSGSLGLGPVNKLNASIDEDGEEWRIGGSWLSKVGIFNLNFGKKDYDDNSTQTNYSIGTFVPLSLINFEPWGTQVFMMAGYTYNDGEIACDTSVQNCGNDFSISDMNGDIAFVPSTSSAGYLGFFSLKPINDKWRILSAIAGSLGSNDYHGYVLSIGAGYSITKRQSIAAYGFIQDNSYGDDQRLGISYKYQFN